MKTLQLLFTVLLALSLFACSDKKPEPTPQIIGDAATNYDSDELPAKNLNHTNVVLILIDDLNHYGVTAYGANKLHSYDGEFTNKEFSTPNIDQLAREGLRVDNAFAYPICENTRIALMSGKRNDRNYLQPKSQHASDLTFGDAFKRAGYTTGLFGKWKQTRGTKEIPAKDYISEFGWDDYAAFDVVTEGQRFINPNLVINGKEFNYNKRSDMDPETGRRWYGPDIVNRHALQFIDTNKDKPFFLYYPMILVHDDHKPTPHTQPDSVFDSFPENADYNNQRGDDRQYFPDMIEYMDFLIGKVVKRLEQHGLRENTLIVIMGDNGTKETFGHIMPDGTIYPGRKGGNADNGLHVPLILNQPKVIPDAGDGSFRSYPGLVNLTDIYPTIAEAAGIEMPQAEQVDGISFWPQAKGANGEPRDHIYTWYIGNNKYTDEDLHLRYAFNKEFKRYAPDKDFPEGRFFDLRSDLLERDGDRFVEKKWGIVRFSGLKPESLTDEQRQAYDVLGKILDDNKIERVSALAISPPTTNAITVGDHITLNYSVQPAKAKRQGVVWESSAPSIASVDKFGVVTGLKPGTANIRVYSWDDAKPLAANTSPTYKTDGISDEVTITVK